jgi:hypothetical protein
MVWAGTATLNAKRSPSQAQPYFTLYHEGLGSGWATGNFIQFETCSAQAYSLQFFGKFFFTGFVHGYLYD